MAVAFRYFVLEVGLTYCGSNKDIATILAFWNNDGAHSTGKQEYTDWNAEIIKAMVEDIQPTEELFQVESQRILNAFKQSTHNGLTAMLLRLIRTSVGINSCTRERRLTESRTSRSR